MKNFMKKKKLWQRLGALLLMTSVLAGSIPANGYAAEVEPAVAAETEADTAAEETESVQEEAEEPEISGNEEETEKEVLPEIPVNENPEQEDSGDILPEIPVKTEPETELEVTENGETEGQTEDEAQEDEQEEPQQETSEETEETGDGQYHFTEDDLSSVARWRELYLPNGYEDLEHYDDTWWDQLYDYERDLAEYLKDLNVELSDQVYMDQSLEECIAVMESGVPPEAFFAGTIYQGLALEDFYEFRDAGYTMEDLYEQWEPIQPLSLSDGDLVSKMTVSSTGYSGTGHGIIYKLTVGGKEALCMSMGKSARSTYLYKANPGDYEKKDDGIGFIVYSYGRLGGINYVCAQIALWLYQNSSSYSESTVKTRAVAMLNTSGMDEDALERYGNFVWNVYSGAQKQSHSYYVFHSENANSQTVGLSSLPDTFPYEGGESGGGTGGGGESSEYETASISADASDKISAEAKLTITKHDSLTEEVLEGAQITINGKTYPSGTNGSVTHREKESHEASASGPTYTYVVNWDSLDDSQKADADSHGYYHSRDAAYAASKEQASGQIESELSDWAHDWRAKFQATETVPPYGYCNNLENTYSVTAKDGQHKYHDFYNKPWEAWLKVVKHDSVTGQTDFSLSDADFSVYEFQKATGDYVPYRYEDRQLMKDQGDGTYLVGPLYYNPSNQGKFMIVETRSPYGYTIDQTTNRFYFQITGEQKITFTQGNAWNTAGTYPASEENPYPFQAYNEPWKIKVNVDKQDEDTGKRLSGVFFQILRYNRDTADYELDSGYTPRTISVTEQPDGTYLSDWIYWNYQNQGKCYLVEANARKGYFGDWKNRLVELITGHPAGWNDDDAEGKTAYYFQITGSRTEEGSVEGYNNQKTMTATANRKGTVTNERTKGRVTVLKYDTESETGNPQGDAVLDGAVYELRAAADIIHADGHTGTIYRKGDLVRTGTVGDIPGGFEFHDLELGSYMLKEVQAPEGYMLDETTYYLTFTYDDETQRVILRDEASREDANTLTVDDQDPGNEIVYTGDHVQKKAFSMVKTSDNQSQTELKPIKGAGFTVYLVSELAAVRKGQIQPENGISWSSADIRKFYDYDFTGEQAATVYKRKLENWTDGDRAWLVPAASGQKNAYQVAEMFTDEKGALTSPELPYGTYVVVETTTPENHVMAQPFFVYITDDGGVVYTDSTRQQVKETFREEKDIRFGDHANASVYKDRSVYDPSAVEGRVPQDTRYISDNCTEAYVRLVKVDAEKLPADGTVLKPEELVSGTVLKEGAAYRLKVTEMTEREQETMTKTGWKQDAEGYLWYYEPSSRKEYGTVNCPFAPTVLRNAEGKITDCYLVLPAKLPTGSYELAEVKAPEGYVRNGAEEVLEDASTDRNQAYEVKSLPGIPVKFTVDNDSVYPDGQMGGNKYTLTDSYGNLICTVVQGNQEQKGILELIKHGEKFYDAAEEGASLQEKLDEHYFRPVWELPEYHKKDLIFDYEDAPIEGAVFEIYAAEDIYTQELDKEKLSEYGVPLEDYLVWHKDDKVGTITTDQTGYAYLADLYIGSYYIREVTAGDGFVLNDEIQYFEITPQEQEVNFEWVSSDYENRRQKVRLEVSKEDVETGESLAGAVYGLYNTEDIYSYITKNTDKTVPDYRHVQTIFDYKNVDEGRLLIPAGTLVATAVTDEEGKAVFSEDLPLGKYEVRELEGPKGYTTSDEQLQVDASYESEQGGQQVEVQDHTDLLYENQKIKHVFTKSDLTSGIHIGGAYLEVWEIQTDAHGNPKKNPDGSWLLMEEPVDHWISKKAGEEVHYFYEDQGFYKEIASPEDLPEGASLIVKEGHLIEKLMEGRQYILRETLAPENYVGYEASDDSTKESNREENAVTEEVRFYVEGTNLVAEHDLKDQRTVGSFTVTKEGEFLVGAEKSITDQLRGFFTTLFRYLLGRVEQAAFEVYVKDDILTPDDSGNYAVWTNAAGEQLELRKDTKIETITTDWTGTASVKNLPLGTYYVKEVKAGNGTFLLNPEIKEVVLSYENQDTPIVFAKDTTYINARQKIEIRIHKKADNPEGENTPIEGAVFGLYAAEDLYGYAVSGDRVVTHYSDPYIKKDQLLEALASDEQGLAVFRADVPNGRYYVKELQPAPGYLENPAIYEFDASYTGEQGDEVLVFEQEVLNTAARIQVSKQDLTNGQEIPGATLRIVEKETGKIVDTWISEEIPHTVSGLRLSGTEEYRYLLQETLPAPGYVTAEEIEFRLSQDRDASGQWMDSSTVQILERQDNVEIWTSLEENRLVMKDDTTQVEIQKRDKETQELLEGAELTLYDANEQEVMSWISQSDEGYLMMRLPIGTYRLEEKKAPKGYLTAEPLVFEVLDESGVQVIVLEDERIPEKKTHKKKDSGSSSGEETPENSQPVTAEAAGTGDSSDFLLWIALLAAAIAGTGLGIAVYDWRKKV